MLPFLGSLELLHTDGRQDGFVDTWVGTTLGLYQPVFITASDINTPQLSQEVMHVLGTEKIKTRDTKSHKK